MPVIYSAVVVVWLVMWCPALRCCIDLGLSIGRSIDRSGDERVGHRGGGGCNRSQGECVLGLVVMYIVGGLFRRRRGGGGGGEGRFTLKAFLFGEWGGRRMGSFSLRGRRGRLTPWPCLFYGGGAKAPFLEGGLWDRTQPSIFTIHVIPEDAAFAPPKYLSYCLNSPTHSPLRKSSSLPSQQGRRGLICRRN